MPTHTKRCISWSRAPPASSSTLHSPAVISPSSIPRLLFCSSPASCYATSSRARCVHLQHGHGSPSSTTTPSAEPAKGKGGDEIVAMMLARLTQMTTARLRRLVFLIEPCQYLSTLSYTTCFQSAYSCQQNRSRFMHEVRAVMYAPSYS
jgi:hypothetical protein